MNNGGGCTLTGPGRGDCLHFIGLPGRSIPGQHDGPDDTVDEYGKPNDWCWLCWKSNQYERLSDEFQKLMDAHQELSREHDSLVLQRQSQK